MGLKRSSSEGRLERKKTTGHKKQSKEQDRELRRKAVSEGSRQLPSLKCGECGFPLLVFLPSQVCPYED